MQGVQFSMGGPYTFQYDDIHNYRYSNFYLHWNCMSIPLWNLSPPRVSVTGLLNLVDSTFWCINTNCFFCWCGNYHLCYKTVIGCFLGAVFVCSGVPQAGDGARQGVYSSRLRQCTHSPGQLSAPAQRDQAAEELGKAGPNVCRRCMLATGLDMLYF